MKELYKNLLQEVEREHAEHHLRVRNSRVLIIDGLNTFIRSWTTNPAMNEDGDHVGGVTGTLNSIGFQIRQLNPTRVIVVFDGKNGSESRKKIFEGYKSERGKNKFRVNRRYPEMMNEEEESVSMKRQFIWLVDILYHLPVTTMVYDGIEADDVLAYIATELNTDGNECIIASTDKDFLQLVNDKVTVYSSTKKKHYHREDVFNDWGIWPQNLLLFRTLDGDVSDNVPGIKGLGLKTFLKRFPEFTEDRLVDFDELFMLANERTKNGKIYKDILNNRHIVERNKKLMDLSVPSIPVNDRMKIMDRYNDTDRKFEKFEFLQIALKYKLMHTWKDINTWLSSTWTNIITE